MPKVTLNKNDFKTLASETRMNIIKVLDGKKLSLNDISKKTNLSKMTLHEHLEKLIESDFVKKIQRPGHKWIYYTLSWKGKGLVHPENNKVVIMFCLTIFTITVGIIGSLKCIYEYVMFMGSQPYNPIKGPKHPILNLDTNFVILTIIFIITSIFLIWLTFKIYKANKEIRA